MKHIMLFEQFSKSLNEGAENSKEDLVGKIGDLDSILLYSSNERAQKEWDKISSEYLESNPNIAYWSDLGEFELLDAIEAALLLMQKYNIKESLLEDEIEIKVNGDYEIEIEKDDEDEEEGEKEGEKEKKKEGEKEGEEEKKKEGEKEKIGEGFKVNEELYDFVRDIESALGQRAPRWQIEDYLGRKLSSSELSALGIGTSNSSWGRYGKGYGRKWSYTKKAKSFSPTVDASKPLTFGKHKGKMWKDIPDGYRYWMEGKFKIINMPK